MNGLNVVVVGGSAGAIDAVISLGQSMSPDLNAAVFVCIHVSLSSPGALPELIGRRSELASAYARDGERIEAGRIYVAPPDRHMLIEGDRVRLSRGPRENNHRPAIDPLFRSASHYFRSRVIGIVLSGNLDDGALGLREIRRHGGYGIVQDPAEAVFEGMPSAAIETAGADEVLPLDRIAPAVASRIAASAALPAPDLAPTDEGFAMTEDAESMRASHFSCPACGGVLWEEANDRTIHYRCRVGHGFSEETLLDSQTDALDRAMWAALRALEESGEQARRLAERMEQRAHPRLATRFLNQARDADMRAAIIRRALFAVNEADAEKQAG